MFDVDKFIECVHERPALWEKRSKEYSDKNCRERSWVEIGETMFQDWQELEPAERDEKVKEMKNKWRHIRDNFHRFVQQGKSGDAAPKKKRKYVYADALGFLLNTMEKRKTSGNIGEDEEAEEDDDEEREDNGEQNDDDDDIEPGPSTQPPKVSQTSQTRPRQRSMPNLTHFQKELLKKLDDTPKQEEEDADKSFLMSLLPDYKTLNNDDKIDFRLMTLQFFREIRRKANLQNPLPGTYNQATYPPTYFSPLNPSYHFPSSSFNTTPPSFHYSTPLSYPTTSPQDSLHSQTSTYESL